MESSVICKILTVKCYFFMGKFCDKSTMHKNYIIILCVLLAFFTNKVSKEISKGFLLNFTQYFSLEHSTHERSFNSLVNEIKYLTSKICLRLVLDD